MKILKILYEYSHRITQRTHKENVGLTLHLGNYRTTKLETKFFENITLGNVINFTIITFTESGRTNLLFLQFISKHRLKLLDLDNR